MTSRFRLTHLRFLLPRFSSSPLIPSPAFPQGLLPDGIGRHLRTLCSLTTVETASINTANSSSQQNNSGEDQSNAVRYTLSPVSMQKEEESDADDIGYRVVGLFKADKPLKVLDQPVFAVIQLGSHQFKVTPGDLIYTEKLKYADINHKLLLNKVLLLGTKVETIIGRPLVPNANVSAIVEEQALDAKVIIFKKKRRKNYRRTKGHRQELTRLRILDIEGIEKADPAIVDSEKVAAMAA